MTKVKTRIVRYFFWVLSFSIMVFIFFFSAEGGAASGATSTGLIKFLLETFSKAYNEAVEADKLLMIENMQFIVRKGAHFSIYASLGLSLFSAAWTYNISTIKKFLIALPISLIYAVSDEYHQTFIPGRAGMFEDVILDFTGAVTGALFVWCIIVIYNKIKNRSKVMRKKELMLRLSELVSTVEKLSGQIKDLKSENEELKQMLEELSSADCESVCESQELPEIVHNPDAFKTDGFSVKVIEEIDFDNSHTEVSNKSEPVLDDALEYGAGIIGKITVESAKYCDKVTEKGGDNVRELLGLIMGKSEVCKSDILSIAMSSTSDESKREFIDSQFAEAIDYFKSISEQNI